MRDIVNNNVEIHFTASLNPNTIGNLLNQYKHELQDPSFKRQNDFIKRLQRFLVNISTAKIQTLEEKLVEGGFDENLEYALLTKEEFSKFLLEYKFSPSIQNINAIFLGKIFDQFNMFILPEIRKGTDHIVINELINSTIIAPIESLILDNDCDIDILTHHIRGMIFFLTGKCHIKWN
ncbi:ABC-three component system protein [Siphonobacter curvatus]|nr:ABC-three component system protein [Siphonobacter curvatus]